MIEEQSPHPVDEHVEQYSLGVLAEASVPVFEQHLLTCHDCQDRVAEMDAEIQAMQAAARELRAQEVQKRSKASSCA